MKRLFVPLASAPFDWFRSGRKRWELRRYGRQYTTRNIMPGRTVELRRGYGSQTDVLWGTVTQTVTAGSLSEFFDRVPYELVIPTAKDKSEAVSIATSILRLAPEQSTALLGFEVTLR